jgi:hypothetical protein
MLRDSTPPGFYLVADTAFPRGTDAIEGCIRAPLKTGQRLRGTHEDIEARLAFDRQLLSYCQSAEWGNAALKGAFGQLRLPLEIWNKERRANLLECCMRGHCLRTRRVGLNQIQTVYEPRWNAGDSLADLGDVLFAEQRLNDRVARYHTLAMYP